MSKIYDEAKTATLKEVRALKVGDIIKAFYTDSEEPSLHVVVTQWGNLRSGRHHDIDTIPVGGMGMRSQNWNGARGLNTDKWVRVAHGSDIQQMMELHAAQQADLFVLAADVNAKTELYVHTAKAIALGEPADRLFLVAYTDDQGYRIAWKCQITKAGIDHPGYKKPMTVGQVESGHGANREYPNGSTPTAWFKPDSLYKRIDIITLAGRISKLK